MTVIQQISTFIVFLRGRNRISRLKKSHMIASFFVLASLSSQSQACPNQTTPTGNGRCLLNRQITGTVVTLDPKFEYVISGRVFVGVDSAVAREEGQLGLTSGYRPETIERLQVSETVKASLRAKMVRRASLIIPAGTILKGAAGQDALIVSRGSQIFVNGTKEQPVVMTGSSSGNAPLQRGAWGGLVINGSAPTHNCNESTPQCLDIEQGVRGEAETGFYGGNHPQDNSGSIRYLRVEYAGFPFNDENELNGIAFQGVGSATTVEFIQAHMANDDGVEFFGGTVNVKNVVITGALDDSLDWVAGWTGKAQFVLIQQANDFGDNGIEADNSGSQMDLQPRSNPMIANMTLIGSGQTARPGVGVRLRAGTGAEIYNSVITGSRHCLDINDEATFAANAIGFEGVIFDCESPVLADSGDRFDVLQWFLAQEENRVEAVSLKGFMPQNEMPSLLDLLFHPLYEDAFFTPVDYVGGISQENDWAAGWTVGL